MDRITAPRTFSVSSIVASRSETPDAFLQSKSLQSIHLSGYRKPSKGDTAIDKRLLRVDEAAMLLNVSRWTIYRWVHDGRLEATKLTTGSLRIFHDSVLALIEQNRTVKTELSKVPRSPTQR